ncbi:MAG: sigma-54-dependent Fis family transcriptional regulator [Bdellovibrionaceae bacterium]|nr:sigma-54-dependent Fis family transcriptional regulator [Pseudobdellovibrionaceae bacterium]
MTSEKNSDSQVSSKNALQSTRAFHLLLVDDDPLIHQALKLCLPKEWNVYGVQDPNHVPFERFFHAAFVDMHLFGDLTNPAGIKVIERLARSQPQLEIVAISGDMNRSLMELCLKAGAQRFLAKPLSAEELRMLLDKIAALWNLRLIDHADRGQAYRWIGHSAASLGIRKKIADLKGEEKPILLEGETGTGKEVVARLLHQQEPARPLISINMASLPEALFESELFGHVKGAFTGADTNKIGLVEAAHGGDLFLDEIEALSLTNQAKLLRFLENGEIRKVGGKDIIKVQTRVIAASNRSLQQMVRDSQFREDLFFRLASQRLQLPPLRDRKEDVLELSEFFLEIEKPRRNKKFTADGSEALLNYDWPGNVRELQRICEQLSLVSPLPLIRKEDVEALLIPQPNSAKSFGTLSPRLNLALGLAALCEQFETQVIKQALQVDSDIDAAAHLLKISRSSLYKKIKDYRIDQENPT